MFKKIFGPKKVEGVGTPIPTEELRANILTYFPKAEGVNQYLTFEDSKDSPDGFNAVWKLYARDRDDDGIRRKYLVSYSKSEYPAARKFCHHKEQAFCQDSACTRW